MTLLRCTLVLLAAGCGGGDPATPEPAPSPEPTSGGEHAEPVPDAAPEPVMRTTTPIPVPQPALARESLHAGVQRVWELVERALELRPPEPPSEGTAEALDAWAAGPFRQWFGARRAAMDEVAAAVLELGESTPRQQVAVAAALLGYAYEDMAAGVRGAPVPEEIAADPELLDVYVQALSGATQPLAVEAARGYAGCVRIFTEAGAEPWGEWAAYCDQRGAEVVETFGLQDARATD